MRPVASRGRWVWILSGLVTAVALAVPGARLIASAGATPQQPQNTVTRAVPTPQPAPSVVVSTDGGPAQVTASATR
jgi:hypothetical protein